MDLLISNKIKEYWERNALKGDKIKVIEEMQKMKLKIYGNVMKGMQRLQNKSKKSDFLEYYIIFFNTEYYN